MVRSRSTRFRKDSVSLATQVSIPSVARPTLTTSQSSSRRKSSPTRTTSRTTSRRSGRSTRFTKKPRTTTTRTTTPTRVTTTPTRTTRPTRAGTPQERSRKRDDFQRSLSLPVIREAFAEEAPRSAEAPRSQQTVIPIERPTAVSLSRGGRGGRIVSSGSITPVRATTKSDSISLVATPLPSANTVQRKKFSVPFETQQEANQRLLDAGVPTFAQAERRRGLSDLELQIGSFGGGVRQEIENIGSIAGIGTARREVGSLLIDLPFAVAGETFTRPSAEGQAGVLGLGFEFRSSPDFDAGFEKSGEIQTEIGKKFEEDPARAVGSIFAVATIEAGLLVTTGGVGNLARRGLIQVGKKVADSKGRKVAEKVAREQPAFRKGIDQLIENLGDGRFAILQGVEQIGKRVGTVRVLRGGGLVTSRVTKSGKIIEKELNVIRGGITKTGRKGKLKGSRAVITSKVKQQAEVPLIIVDTKKRLVKNAVTGQTTREEARTFLFNKNIPDRAKFLENPDLLNIVGADEASLKLLGGVTKTGLKRVKGKRFALRSEGKVSKRALKITAEAEKFGQVRTSARGISVLTKDARSTKRGLGSLIGQFAVSQTGIGRAVKLTKLTGTEIREGIKRGRPKPQAKPDTNLIPFSSVEIIQAKQIGGRTLSQRLSPDPLRSRDLVLEGSIGKRLPRVKPKGRKGGRAKPEKVDDFNVLNPFGSSRARPQRTVQVRAGKSPRATTDTQAIFEAFTTPARKIRPARVPLGARVAIGTIQTQVRLPTTRVRQKDDFAIFQGEVIGQLPKQRAGQGSRLDQRGGFFGTVPTRTIQTPITERPITTPFLRTDTTFVPRQKQRQIVIPTFDTPPIIPTTGGVVTPRPPILGGGLPSPFFPPTDEEKRRRGTKKRKSRLGGRLFDVADEPFGELSVGLGFFVETERGESTIEEALGRDDEIDFEPITRQEKQARARLGKNGKNGKRRSNNDEFDLGNFFG